MVIKNCEILNTIVIIPTYNERFNIEKLIHDILNLYPNFDILVVDGNSSDGTGTLVDAICNEFPNVQILHQPLKSGLGKAYLSGFRYALSINPPYERIIQMDADFSHHPEYLEALRDATLKTDIAIGSRYIKGAHTFHWQCLRRTISFIANVWVRALLGINIKDCTSGFRCFRREVLENIELDTIRSNGYLFQIETLVRSLNIRYSIAEVPITFIERRFGKTKMGFFEICEAFCGTLRLCLEKMIKNR